EPAPQPAAAPAPPEQEPVPVPLAEESPPPPPAPAPAFSDDLAVRVVHEHRRSAARGAPAAVFSDDPAVWEQWIGRRLLGWTSVALGIFAVGFFLKYAYARGWIVPAGRVAIGELVGATLVALGAWAQLRGARLPAQMFFGCGIATLYLSTY